MDGTVNTADAEDVAQLFVRHRQTAIGVARYSGADPTAAEDAVSEVFAALLSRPGLQVQNPAAYLARAVRNRTTDWHRRAARQQAIASQLRHAHERTTTAEPEQQIADRAALLQLLARLPRSQRQAVTLRFLKDLSERDTAAAMGVSVGAVKSYTSRGLAALRMLMAYEAA